MGATFAAVAAAGVARAEADLLERFRVSDATAPGRAQTLNKLGLEGSRYLDRFQSAGVIRQAPGGGQYYLDEVAFAAYRRQRRNPWALAGALCLALAAMILGATMFLMSQPR
jgi:hypothetical protein